MKKKRAKNTTEKIDFESLFFSIVEFHRQAQEFATKAGNVGLTLRNWFIGDRSAEFEQNGADRAAYGESLRDARSQRLAAHGLSRVTPCGLRRYRQLNQVYPQIWQSVTVESQKRSPLRVCPRRPAQQALRLPLRRGNAEEGRGGSHRQTTWEGDRP